MEWKSVRCDGFRASYYKNTCDQRREPTGIDHMFSDYEQG